MWQPNKNFKRWKMSTGCGWLLSKTFVDRITSLFSKLQEQNKTTTTVDEYYCQVLFHHTTTSVLDSLSLLARISCCCYIYWPLANAQYGQNAQQEIFVPICSVSISSCKSFQIPCRVKLLLYLTKIMKRLWRMKLYVIKNRMILIWYHHKR